MTASNRISQGDKAFFIADQDLSAHRGVSAVGLGRVHYCDATSVPDAFTFAGITLNAALADERIIVQNANIVYEPSWNWSTGLIYCGTNGEITQMFDPTWKWARVIGFAIDENRIMLRPSPAIVLI